MAFDDDDDEYGLTVVTFQGLALKGASLAANMFILVHMYNVTKGNVTWLRQK